MKSFSQFLKEDGPVGGAGPVMTGSVAANKTGDGIAMQPAKKVGLRRFKTFRVESEIFRKFEKGRRLYERWENFLDMNNFGHKTIYEYAVANPTHVIVLEDAETGAIHAVSRKE